jgi:phosphoribosylaminoimidazole-succinocarboxamide synthase
VTLALLTKGKVRDIYDAGDNLLIVASDRISAFDVILPTAIPDKGRVLTGLSLFWFDRTRDIVANHVVSADPADLPTGSDHQLAARAMLVRRAEPVKLECVARGFVSGSGWTQYRETGSICGVRLPRGLVESERLTEPIFTPTTKAETGHDQPLTMDEASDLLGRGLAERLRELTVQIYERAAEASLARGIILADTKLEFGFADGELILIDEVCTPDSSRFWPADRYRPGGPQPSFDKQYVRDWLDESGWDHEPPPPSLPDEVVRQTANRYREAYERLAGELFSAYLTRMGAEG